MERCRPRRPHPETSEGRVRKAAVVLALDSKKRQTFKPDSFDNRPGRNLSESDTMVCEDSLVTLPRNRRVGSVGVFILCGNLWRYFHLRGPRFSPYGDTVNLSRSFFSPAILTLRVNPHPPRKRKEQLPHAEGNVDRK